MVKIKPFKAVHYNQGMFDDISKLLARPYDVFDDVERDLYYNISQYNVVRLIRGKEMSGDNGENKYIRAKEYFDRWLEDGILVEEKAPSLFAYEKIYTIKGEERRTLSLVSLVKVEDYESKEIIPHEDTLPHKVEDRKALFRATDAQFSVIFGLYKDDEKRVEKLMEEEMENEPFICVGTKEGAQHTLWKIENEENIDIMQGLMGPKNLLIADGHHRYKTMLTLRNEEKKKNPESTKYDYVLFRLVAMGDGLTVLPTHRVAKLNRQPEKIIGMLSPHFIFKEQESLDSLLSSLSEMHESEHWYGVYLGKKYYLAKLKSELDPKELIPGKSSLHWKSLDMAILHKFVFENLFGIQKEQVDRQEKVNFIKEEKEAVSKVDSGEFDCAFFLNPPNVDEINRVAEAGDRMPQKTTYFYPKMLSGMLMRKL